MRDAGASFSNKTYVHSGGPIGWDGVHSVKLVGYGTDAEGTPYWTCENSWGYSGGFDFHTNLPPPDPKYQNRGGYFRIRRGTNECGIESLAYSGTPRDA